MVKVHVHDTIRKLKSNFRELDKQSVQSATMRAINRTLTKGRTSARKAVKAEYNIPQKNLNGIAKKDATRALLVGYIMASSVPVPMDAFSPKFQTAKKSISITRRGVQKINTFKKAKSKTQPLTIEVKKGRRESVDHAFMIQGAKPRVFARGEYRRGGGSYGFMKRNKRVNKSGTDTPIKPLISVTVHGAVINNKVEKNIAGEIEPYFGRRLQHEFSRQLQKMKE